jgi:uncharacterized coiled-coil protein SlyX
MADNGDMTLEQRVDRLEKSLGKNDDLVRELRDAVTVTARLDAAQSRALKEHAKAIASHDRWMIEHKEAMTEHRESMKDLDERISKLVSGFGEFMRDRQ